MTPDAVALRTRLPAGMQSLLSPVILASQPTETARFVAMQYVPSAFYCTDGLQCYGPARAISRLLTPADLAELAANREDVP